MAPGESGRTTRRSEIGQMIAVGVSGPELTPEERSLVSSYGIGWVVLFGRNIFDPSQTANLCRELHRLGENRILVAVDQEGGQVSRLPPPFTQFPAASALSHCEPERVRRMALAMAREMRAVGIDLNLAPVLDVRSNPKDPVIKDRAFSSDPETVARLGSAMILGLLAGGVAPCGKHFPGHGDTDADSHMTLPVVAASEATLRERELRPFRAAISQGVPCLMTAHVLYPHLDPGRPATLSQRILTGLLREELRFTGLVFSDDMGMKAIPSPVEAAVQALRAGVDVLLVCHDLKLAVQTLEALEDAAREESFLRKRAAESFRRVRRWKIMATRSTVGEPSLGTIGCEEHKRLAT